MKKILLIFGFCLFAMTGYSQEVGIRFGDALGGNVALDATFGTGASRIHADLAFGNGVGLEVLWDLLYSELGSSPLNWYLGVGPSALIQDSYFGLGVAGEIGLEWVIEGAPITIGADWRPVFVLIEDTDFRADSFGLNVRYRFGG